jgi:hypothetical protein
MDPRRADRLRHPTVRLYGEYIWAYLAAIQRAPLSATERRACRRWLASWVLQRVRPGMATQGAEPPEVADADIRLDQLVPGWQKKSA